jgi:hypothetical protein
MPKVKHATRSAGAEKSSKTNTTNTTNVSGQCYLLQLPVEVLAGVLEFLPEWNEVARLRKVSQLWMKAVAWRVEVALTPLIRAGEGVWTPISGTVSFNRLTLCSANYMSEGFLQSIKSVDLAAGWGWSTTKEIQYFVARFPHVESFSLRNQLTEGGAKCLKQLTRLQSLSIAGNDRLPDEGLLEFSAMTSLQSLDLSWCAKLSSLHHLGPTVQAQLKHLKLTGCKQLTNAAVVEISTRCLRLETLHLASCELLSDEAFTALGATTAPIQLLNLSGCHLVTDFGVHSLAALRSLTNLDISFCKNLLDFSLQSLSTLPSLQTLNIGGCRLVTDTGVKALANLSCLKSLNVSNCVQVGDASLQQLASAASSLVLESLNLSGCTTITSLGLRHLAQLPVLSWLNLSSCTQLNDESVAALASGSDNLRVLRLARLQQLTDAGVQHVAKLPALEHLDVSGCPLLTGKILEALAMNPTFTSLEIGGCYKVNSDALPPTFKPSFAIRR